MNLIIYKIIGHIDTFMAKVILFDFWGTIVENGVWSPVKQIRNILNIRIPFQEYIVRMEKSMMTSNYESLREAFENVCQEFNIPIEDEKIDKLIGLWNKSWMLAEPYSEVNESLQKIKQGHKLILVSNSDKFSIRNVLEKFKLNNYFDSIYLSCDLGKIKSDPNFFRIILNEENINPEDCIMIGDSIQSDIIPAKENKIRTILIDRRNSREYHPKVKDLKELEKVLEI